MFSTKTKDTPMRFVYSTAAVMAAVFLVSPIAFSQVEVVESSPTTIRPIGQPRNTSPSAIPVQAPESMQSEMYYQLQTLQQEVATLRGIIEEQSYELSRLKQQRMDDYADLDRRVAGLSNGGAPIPSSNNSQAGILDDGLESSAGAATAVAARPTTAPSAAEASSYNNAMDLIRSKQYDQAIAAFNKHLTDFSGGQYSANAYHWLGQLYQLRNNPQKARDSYNEVITNYPNHAKASDAKLKLGQVYFQLGDKAKAKTLLEEVANSNTDEARLAKSYLQENF